MIFTFKIVSGHVQVTIASNMYAFCVKCILLSNYDLKNSNNVTNMTHESQPLYSLQLEPSAIQCSIGPLLLRHLQKN